MTAPPTPSAEIDESMLVYLAECLTLVRDIAHDCRPCPGGYTQRAKELWVRHEQEREVDT